MIILQIQPQPNNFKRGKTTVKASTVPKNTIPAIIR